MSELIQYLNRKARIRPRSENPPPKMPNKPQTLADVAALLGVTPKFLKLALLRVPRYTTFSIPKKSGGNRQISAPAPLIKQWQRKLLAYFESEYQGRSPVHGFQTGRSILTNAQQHVKPRFVLNLDLRDFFPTIHFGRVRGLLQGKPYFIGREASRVIANICVYNKTLPQGAPTSPILANMICAKMDSELKALAKKHRCTYTRYADDLTFSTRLSSFPAALASQPTGSGLGIVLGPELLRTISSNGFNINDKKVRLGNRHYRLEVTGLTVNRFPNVQRRFIRQIRAMLHAWKKYGIKAAENEFRAKFDKRKRTLTLPPFEAVVRGKIEFVGSIRGKSDPLYWRLLRVYATLDPNCHPIEPPGFVEYDIQELKKGIVVLNDLTGFKQGSAFYLDGVGLVTCSHIIDDETNLVITEANDPLDTQTPVELVIRDKMIDLAILKPKLHPKKNLVLGDENELKQLDGVMLCGFPKHHKGADVSMSQGQFIHEYKFSGMRRFHISATILDGNSGGPVLNSRNQVIGVAAQGPPESLNSVVPISEALRLAFKANPANAQPAA